MIALGVAIGIVVAGLGAVVWLVFWGSEDES